MTNDERAELRKLQDAWLKNNEALLDRFPDCATITDGGPTIRQVKTCVLPTWAAHFRRTLHGIA